jgi:hypothetical protein
MTGHSPEYDLGVTSGTSTSITNRVTFGYIVRTENSDKTSELIAGVKNEKRIERKTK